MTTPPPPPPPPPGGPAFGGPTGALTGRTYANWGYRVLAYIIDVIPLAILNGIGFLLGKPETMTTTTDSGVTITTTSGLGIWYWLFWALGIIYLFWNKAYREGTTTQSLGKSALGMHTVGMRSGQAIGFGVDHMDGRPPGVGTGRGGHEQGLSTGRKAAGLASTGFQDFLYFAPGSGTRYA